MTTNHACPGGLNPADLLLHRTPLLLLETIQAVSEDKCIARTRVDPSSCFAEPDGSMPGWFGLELMAQTIAAYSGAGKRALGLPPKLGFNLGTRSYEVTVPSFPPGAELEIETRLHYLDESGLSAFACEIRHLGRPLARAMVKTFEPS